MNKNTILTIFLSILLVLQVLFITTIAINYDSNSGGNPIYCHKRNSEGRCICYELDKDGNCIRRGVGSEHE